uniref:MDM2 binding protein n=1 Tax=Leptobrachium leishanense TaxID=445787 RepID=A0A8C5MPP4_9ANUR
MDRFVLLVNWEKGLIPPGFAAVREVYAQLKDKCAKYTNTFPACSVSGAPAARKCYFALHITYGSFQFCSSDWEAFALGQDDGEDPPQSAVEECLNALQSFEEEEESSRDSTSQTSSFEESAESLQLLSDKLPAPGKALVDVLLLSSSSDVPKWKVSVPVVGVFKHLKEWHSAKITIVTEDSKGWQKIASFLSACVVPTEALNSALDPQELWRGALEVHEKKFCSEVEFPAFCLCWPSERSDQSNRSVSSPEAFHYYGSSLKFVRMVELSQIPSYFTSRQVFELRLTPNAPHGKSKLMLNQLCQLGGKVGAIFMLPCNVCSLPNPPAIQRSTRKWREYLCRKPKEMKIPDVDLKGENCCYYFLVQSKGSEACTATMLHSASQTNGAASLAVLHHKLNVRPGAIQNQLNALSYLQLYHSDTIIRREKALAHFQALAVKEYLSRREASRGSSCSVGDLKRLLSMTRDDVFRYFATFSQTLSMDSVEAAGSEATPAESGYVTSNPAEWPERNVLQNLENFEKQKQRQRASLLSGSADHLLGRKDGQREPATLLDAKELLRYFTPQGTAVGELQPLQLQRGDNQFLLTPELTPRKLKGLPFEKAASCHYHGLEYCLDNRNALDRDAGFTELQSRLIRYETQTTCTRECCPIPFALSPLPSPAVLSEPGSVPDGESLQGDLKADPLRLKRRSKDLDGLCASKRFAKSESSDSLLSHTSESSGHQPPCRVTRVRPESVSSAPSTVQPRRTRPHSDSAKPTASKESSQHEGHNKESRSQKHHRMLKEVVAKTLNKYGMDESHPCFQACSQRLFDISKFFLKDLTNSRGLLDEMKKAATSNAKQVIQWVLEKSKKS